MINASKDWSKVPGGKSGFFAKHGCSEDDLVQYIERQAAAGYSYRFTAKAFFHAAIIAKDDGEDGIAKHLMARATYTLLNY